MTDSQLPFIERSMLVSVLEAQNESDNADDPDGNLAPSVQEQRKFKIRNGQQMELSAPDGEEVDQEPANEGDHPSDAVGIQRPQQQKRSDDAEDTSDHRSEVQPSIKIHTAADDQGNQTEKTDRAGESENFEHQMVFVLKEGQGVAEGEEFTTPVRVELDYIRILFTSMIFHTAAVKNACR